MQWEEGKFTVWDDSFENELHNESGTAQVMDCCVALLMMSFIGVGMYLGRALLV